MIKPKHILIFVVLSIIISCTKDWEKHYLSPTDSVDQTVWEAIQDDPLLSEFASLFKSSGLDSIFSSGGSFTLFIPDNQAFEEYVPDSEFIEQTLLYHSFDYLINIAAIDNPRTVRSLSEKYTILDQMNGKKRFSEIDINYDSPLYQDGKYYIISEVAKPLPNLSEYISKNCRVLRSYIEGFETTILDLENSIPLGFNNNGDIEYDSVFSAVNYFDSIYFPIRQESRDKSATFILFNDQEYIDALEFMANELGESYSVNDIPSVWQEEVLIPELLSIGSFPNSLNYEAFLEDGLRNLKGDSVWVDYTAISSESKTLCSNGVVFNYVDFRVPSYLYTSEIRIEGEHMVQSQGSDIYFWKPGYTLSGSSAAISAKPSVTSSQGAENDSLVRMNFNTQPFDGTFEFEFYFNNIFPQNYLFIWGANYRPSGYYEVYANDIMIREFDTFNLRQTVFSIDGTGYYFPNNGNNRFDAMIDFLEDYGDVKITIKYTGPGGSSAIKPLNGFSIDFMSLLPVE
jgi:uncharacterized surface protein with fasciclin (FAS1) repeats